MTATTRALPVTPRARRRSVKARRIGLKRIAVKASMYKAAAFIRLALYVWNLIMLVNFVNDRPLGALKPVLDLL